MKYIVLAALFGSVGSALIADETAETCDPVVTLEQLEPLTEEEQLVLAELEAIENDSAVDDQAQAEVEIPLEAFGGC